MRVLPQELPGNELPPIPKMLRASTTGAGALQPSTSVAAPSPLPPGYHSIHASSSSPNQDALQPRAKRDKHAIFTSPPPHLLPLAATPMRGSPSPMAIAAASGHSHTAGHSVLHQGATHQVLGSKSDGSGRAGGGVSPGRKDMHAKIDVRM
jgi:hypothetical protein